MDGIDPNVARWREWIDGPIKNDVIGMHHRRQIWRELGEITDANPGLAAMPSAFWEFATETYATTQAIAIRRQADVTRGTCSLARLISEVRSNATRLTREYFVGLWGEQQEVRLREAHKAFDELAGGAHEHLVARVPTGDLERLARDSAAMKTYVDEHVAHDAAEPTAELPTFADMDAAVDALGHMFKKYSNVLTAGSWVVLEPAVQEDWKAIFRVPWIQQ
jgi:hypothetical protein